MVINKHGSFYLRRGWGTKIIRAVEADNLIFSPAYEQEAIDRIGLGRVIIRALRYWSDVTGLTQEEKVPEGISVVRKPLFDLIASKDRYFQKQGSLLLLHRNMALNEEEATAWYWAFNEMDKSSFSREEFIDGLHYYLAVNGMTIKKAAVEKEWNCFRNTYISEKKVDIRTVMDEDTYPLLAPLHLLRVNNDGEKTKVEKCFLSRANMPIQILVYAIAMDNRQESKNCGQISIDKLLEEKKQVGKYFPMRYSKLLDTLLEAENKKLIALNNNFGNRIIEFTNTQYEKLLDEYYAE